MTLTIQRTLDVGLCMGVLDDPIIYDAISEDGFTEADKKIDVINDIWLRLDDGDTNIGVVYFQPKFSHCYDAHIQILPQHRRDYTQKSGEIILQWCKDNLKGCLIYTNVPAFCESVALFLLSFGFEESGRLKKAYKKRGELHDLIILTKNMGA